MIDRAWLKTAAVALFGAIAEEHPLGHQPSKAARFLVRGEKHDLEVMVERDEKSRLNIWLLDDVGRRVPSRVRRSSSPASGLRATVGKNGKPHYGRHSALEKMPQLGDADLLCLNPSSIEDIGAIADAVFAAGAETSS